MKIVTKLTNLGFEISLADERPKPLKADPDADQEHPRGYYVYAHVDTAGRIFYVGKGTGRRAWSDDRHPLWHRYVGNHLDGQYTVQILRDNLSPEESEQLEADWIAQCSDTVVNWVNAGRATDFDAVAKYHRARNANRELIMSARSKERTDLEDAVRVYCQAIEAIPEYATISYESGLLGQLLAEEAAEFGINGELQALDRLTLCLTRLGRAEQALREAEKYFALYKRDLQLPGATRIRKRVEKALAKALPRQDDALVP
jgi:hypothetical protein